MYTYCPEYQNVLKIVITVSIQMAILSNIDTIRQPEWLWDT